MCSIFTLRLSRKRRQRNFRSNFLGHGDTREKNKQRICPRYSNMNTIKRFAFIYFRDINSGDKQFCCSTCKMSCVPYALLSVSQSCKWSSSVLYILGDNRVLEFLSRLHYVSISYERYLLCPSNHNNNRFLSCIRNAKRSRCKRKGEKRFWVTTKE